MQHARDGAHGQCVGSWTTWWRPTDCTESISPIKVSSMGPLHCASTHGVLHGPMVLALGPLHCPWACCVVHGVPTCCPWGPHVLSMDLLHCPCAQSVINGPITSFIGLRCRPWAFHIIHGRIASSMGPSHHPCTCGVVYGPVVPIGPSHRPWAHPIVHWVIVSSMGLSLECCPWASAGQPQLHDLLRLVLQLSHVALPLLI